jgi:LysR family transcriptional activator of nhaA
VAEFEDNALLTVFAQEGVGIFVAPTAIEKEICRQYRVRPIGELPAVQERYYAISVERKLKHPAVVAISDTAREDLFA